MIEEPRGVNFVAARLERREVTSRLLGSRRRVTRERAGERSYARGYWAFEWRAR
jgi:hypothetical protein